LPFRIISESKLSTVIFVFSFSNFELLKERKYKNLVIFFTCVNSEHRMQEKGTPFDTTLDQLFLPLVNR
jgi:hypothetical protein